jgi:hypothetical protein
MFKAFLLASVTAVAAAMPAQAAQFSYRLSEDQTYTFVYVDGDIANGDYENFKQYTRNLLPGKAVIVLNSDGGAVVEGLSIGMLIRNRNWTTSVRSGYYCASVCGLIWLAGTTRYVGATAKIGFHAAYDTNTGAPTARGNAYIGAYLNELGFGYDAISWFVSAPTNGINLLTPQIAAQYNIAAKAMK